MNLRRIFASVGAAFAVLGSMALAVFLFSLSDQIRQSGTMWVGLILGPVCLMFFCFISFISYEAFSELFDEWWRWLHDRKYERYYR